MIVLLRKHAKWLMIPLFSLVIISFVFFMSVGPARNGGGGGGQGVSSNLVDGEIYGEKVTAEKYASMQNDVSLDYLFRAGAWPRSNPQITPDVMLRETYIHMMLVQKARDIGIHVSDEQVTKAAARFLSAPVLLRALGANSQSVPYDSFISQVLMPAGMNDSDFANFVRNDLAVQQLEMIYGLPGSLITPQEAAEEYEHQFKEVSSQIVFFSASNFLSGAVITPEDVAMFYTNYMAEYRLPERVQVSYVNFSVSNYLADAETQLMRTNLDLIVSNYFNQYGMKLTPDAKTPEESRMEIRKELIRRQALSLAAQDANSLDQAVFNVSPVSPNNLASVARQKGLKVEQTAPFGSDYGPQEFVAPEQFTRAAFQLSPDSPISEPVPGPNGVYIIALETNLQPEIPSLNDIRPRVARDLQYREAIIMAQRAGTNFAANLGRQMASGTGFAAASIGLGYEPQTLPPFSLNTQELPELGDHATLNQLKQTAFTSPVGLPSGFQPSQDGGYVLFVESELPIDQSKMTTDLPQFTAELRQNRESEMFNEWVQHEANRELRDTPLRKFMQAAK